MQKSKIKLSTSPQVLEVLRANPDLDFSSIDLAKAQKGTLVVAGSLFPPQPPSSGLKRGCITSLRYQDDGNDLVRIVVGGVSYTTAQISNLNDFRNRLQEAANFGHEVSFCFYSEDKKMTMLNIYPCGCKCECENCRD